MHYSYCCHYLSILMHSLTWIFCIICVGFFPCMLELASIWYVGPQICAYSLFTSILPPFCTLSFSVSRRILDLCCRWVFTATVPDTVAFNWGNIFLHKCKRPSVSDHSAVFDEQQKASTTSMLVWVLPETWRGGVLIPPLQHVREVGRSFVWWENRQDGVSSW